MNLNSTFEWLPVTTLANGGELRLPLHVVKGARPGPTLGLSGTLHGDEFLPSVAIIRQVLEQIDPAELSGTVMAMPVCNPLGAGARSRLTPADGMNLNSAFANLVKNGSSQEMTPITEQIAQVMTEKFLSHLNYQIDFHSGGDYHAVHMIEFPNTPVGLSMARAFNMPILLRDDWQPDQMWGMSAKLGVECIVAECGGGGALHHEWVERGVQSTFNVMRQLGMLPGKVQPPPKQYVVANDDLKVHNLVLVLPREGGVIIPEPVVTAQFAFDGQPLEGLVTVGKLLNMYDLTVREEYKTPFQRTLLLASVVVPAWHFSGEIAYIYADADKAEVLD
jgi:predicted deacylase